MKVTFPFPKHSRIINSPKYMKPCLNKSHLFANRQVLCIHREDIDLIIGKKEHKHILNKDIMFSIPKFENIIIFEVIEDFVSYFIVAYVMAFAIIIVGVFDMPNYK